MKKKFGLTDQTLEEIKKFLSKNKKIKKAILYGSRAKGNYNKGSDIDIVIVAPEMSFSEYLFFISQIEELPILQKIDITKYELLEENIKSHIQRVGKEIYSREEL